MEIWPGPCKMAENAKFGNVILGFHCIQCRHLLHMKLVTEVAFTLRCEMYCNVIVLCLF